MSCIHQKIDDIYHESYCELTNNPCNGTYGCTRRDDPDPTYNSTTNTYEVVNNGKVEPYNNTSSIKSDNTSLIDNNHNIFDLYGGKAQWHKYYSLFNDCLCDFLKKAELDKSEHTIDILNAISDEVINDFYETWYRQSLGKVRCN